MIWHKRFSCFFFLFFFCKRCLFFSFFYILFVLFVDLSHYSRSFKKKKRKGFSCWLPERKKLRFLICNSRKNINLETARCLSHNAEYNGEPQITDIFCQLQIFLNHSSSTIFYFFFLFRAISFTYISFLFIFCEWTLYQEKEKEKKKIVNLKKSFKFVFFYFQFFAP